jgi:hypothetical protein
MPEETVTTDASATPATETTAATPPADATGTNSGTVDRTFTQTELESIVKSRLERDRDARNKDAEKEKAKREREELERQGEYKKIADDLQAKLDAAEKTVREREIALWQRDAATQTNLPAALASRLKGETLDDMIADAKEILASLPKPAAPNINANNGAGGAPAAGQMSDAEKAELAVRLGVNPKFMT